MSSYVVLHSGTRWVVYVLRAGSYNHPEPRKQIIARRETLAQAESVKADCEWRDAEIERVIRESVR